MKVDGRDKPLSVEEEIPHIDDYFLYEYDAPEYTLTYEIINAEELFSYSDDSFGIRYAFCIILRVSRDAPERLTQKLLSFLQAPTFNS